MLIFKLISFDFNNTVIGLESPSVEHSAQRLRRLGLPVATPLISIMRERGLLQNCINAFLSATLRKFLPEQILYMFHEQQIMPPVGSMVKIPGGIYTVGNNNSLNRSEKPEHRVQIDPFYLGVYPVTFGEFNEAVEDRLYVRKEFWDDEGWSLVDEGDWYPPEFEENEKDLPVTVISWHEVQAYLRWAEKRLPTEHEWEIAASAGQTRAYFPPLAVERDPLGDNIHWNDVDHDAGPSRVNNPYFVPNLFGLFQMLGNVSEMVFDYFDDGYYKRLYKQEKRGRVIERNPKDPHWNNFYVKRGCSFDTRESSWLNVHHRGIFLKPNRVSDLGFRAAKDI
ncbi:MAG: formylglycine-generating enzyme family protein [Candidatus Saganbacteria bacterium]|nr:formylglycine-generating enzyme family protein [Candidatus Saganbacteria bacterium]